MLYFDGDKCIAILESQKFHCFEAEKALPDLSNSSICSSFLVCALLLTLVAVGMAALNISGLNPCHLILHQSRCHAFSLSSPDPLCFEFLPCSRVVHAVSSYW